MPSVYRVDKCAECEDAYPMDESNLCEQCQSDWVDWLKQRDEERLAFAAGHTHDSGASRPSQRSGWPLHMGDPVDTPF